MELFSGFEFRVTARFAQRKSVDHAKASKLQYRAKVRPRPYVSGDFWIRNFFYADKKISASTLSVYESYTTVHTYPIHTRTSQRISQQNSRGKRLVLILWRQRIQKCTDIRASTRIRIHSVHKNFQSGERIQKSLDTPSVYGGHVRTLGVSA